MSVTQTTAAAGSASSRPRYNGKDPKDATDHPALLDYWAGDPLTKN